MTVTQEIRYSKPNGPIPLKAASSDIITSRKKRVWIIATRDFFILAERTQRKEEEGLQSKSPLQTPVMDTALANCLHWALNNCVHL